MFVYPLNVCGVASLGRSAGAISVAAGARDLHRQYPEQCVRVLCRTEFPSLPIPQLSHQNAMKKAVSRSTHGPLICGSGGRTRIPAQDCGDRLYNTVANSSRMGSRTCVATPLVFGSGGRTRTYDTVVNSHLLCRLSYAGTKVQLG